MDGRFKALKKRLEVLPEYCHGSISESRKLDLGKTIDMIPEGKRDYLINLIKMQDLAPHKKVPFADLSPIF